jgi:hypothetical protein
MLVFDAVEGRGFKRGSVVAEEGIPITAYSLQNVLIPTRANDQARYQYQKNNFFHDSLLGFPTAMTENMLAPTAAKNKHFIHIQIYNSTAVVFNVEETDAAGESGKNRGNRDIQGLAAQVPEEQRQG